MRKTQTLKGGPAFPTNPESEFSFGEPGMSLRDWFAGQALSGLVVQTFGYNSVTAPDSVRNLDLAVTAYAIADAMLEKSSKES